MNQPTDPRAIHRQRRGGSCSRADAKQAAFPVAPWGAMPQAWGCTKQNYAVLIVMGVGVED